MPAPKSESVEFQCSYGVFQSRYLWIIPLLGVLGTIIALFGIFMNEGWSFVGTPLEPWQATLMLELMAFVALTLAVVLGIHTRVRRKSPQRVVVTKSTLIAPKSLWSSTELVLPRAEIDLKVINAGVVTQLQIKHGRRKTLLSSAFCPTDEVFEQLLSHLLPE